MVQLSLFDNKIFKVANELLEMLNEDLKINERYKSQFTFIEKGYTVFVVANKHKHVLFNVLDSLGEAPDGFCVNWRTFGHIKQELKIKINK